MNDVQKEEQLRGRAQEARIGGFVPLQTNVNGRGIEIHGGDTLP